VEELGERGAPPPPLRPRRPPRLHPLEERATLPAPPWEREMDGDASSREREMEREKGERGGGGGPSREGREGRQEGRVRAGIGAGQE